MLDVVGETLEGLVLKNVPKDDTLEASLDAFSKGKRINGLFVLIIFSIIISSLNCCGLNSLQINIFERYPFAVAFFFKEVQLV